MRVHYVKHALKTAVCSKCRDKINPSRTVTGSVVQKNGKKQKRKIRVLGDGYAWIKFNRVPRRVRCMKPACAFTRSDLVKSDKLARIYDAHDSAQKEAAVWVGDISELEAIRDRLVETIREVAEEYEESCQNIRDHFSESPVADDCEEKHEALDSWAGDLEGVDFEDYKAPEGTKEGETDEGAEQAWRDEQHDALGTIMEDCPV